MDGYIVNDDFIQDMVKVYSENTMFIERTIKEVVFDKIDEYIFTIINHALLDTKEVQFFIEDFCKIMESIILCNFERILHNSEIDVKYVYGVYKFKYSDSLFEITEERLLGSNAVIPMDFYYGNCESIKMYRYIDCQEVIILGMEGLINERKLLNN